MLIAVWIMRSREQKSGDAYTMTTDMEAATGFGIAD